MPFLKLLGAVYLEDENGVLTGPAVQRHRLALLSMLAVAQPRAIPREKLMAMLWPERDDEHARNLLKQSVYVLRQTLGEQAIVAAGDSLTLAPKAIQSDLLLFEKAIAECEFDEAVRHYGGAFLDGFFLDGAEEFQSWVDSQRERLADAYARALGALAEAAEKRGDLRTACETWKSLVAHSPYDTGVLLRLMKTLASIGDPAAALRQAEIHERALKDELGMRPPAELVAMVAHLQGLAAGAQAGPSVAAIGSAGPASMSVEREATAVRHRRRLIPALAIVIAALILFTQRGILPRDSAPSSGVGADDIAAMVAQELDRRLSGGPLVDPPARRTVSIAAYEAYQRGDDPSLLRSPAGARQALGYFEQAVELDPEYAAAWAGVSRLSMRVANDDDADADELLAQAAEAAQAAIALDESLADAHAVMGLINLLAFELREAESWLLRAASLNRSQSSTHEWLVDVHLWLGRPVDALADAAQAVRLNPLSPSANAELARAHAANGRCGEALARLERLAEVEPPLLRVPLIAAQCHAELGNWQRAIAELGDAVQSAGATDSSDSLRRSLLGSILTRAGRRQEALAVRDALYAQWQNQGGGAFPLAVVDAGLGDIDRVFVWLEQSLADGSLAATSDQFTLLQPFLYTQRGDARFERIAALSHWAEPAASPQNASGPTARSP